MTKVTETDLRRVEDKIDKLADTVGQLTETVTQLAKGQSEIKTELKNEIKTEIKGLSDEFNKRFTEVDKRLIVIEAKLEAWTPSINKISDLAEKVGESKNAKQYLILFITALVSGVIGWFIKK